MPLNQIIAKFLGTDEKHAAKMLELLSIEDCWQKEYEFKGGKYVETPEGKLSAAKIATQADLIRFLQATGQGSWFKGQDLSRIEPHNPKKNLEAYYNLFKALGLVDEVEYPKTLDGPQFSAVLGASQSFVQGILNRVKRDLDSKQSWPSQQIIFGLGSDRVLGTWVKDLEEYSKSQILKLKPAQRLIKTNKQLGKTDESPPPPVEAEMMELVINEMLEQQKKKDEDLQLKCQPIIAYAKDEKSRATTADTVILVKEFIERSIVDNPVLRQLRATGQKIVIVFYGEQPYLTRQIKDIQAILGDNYLAVGVGNGVPFKRFESHPASINICTGEIARFIHTIFTQPVTAARLATEFGANLTEAEQQELASFLGKSFSVSVTTSTTSSLSSPSVVAGPDVSTVLLSPLTSLPQQSVVVPKGLVSDSSVPTQDAKKAELPLQVQVGGSIYQLPPQIVVARAERQAEVVASVAGTADVQSQQQSSGVVMKHG